MGRMALRKVKNLKIKWCTAWRRANKKVKVADVNKKRRRKAKRVVREIIGLTADEINRRKGESTADRNAKRDEAVRTIKDRKARIAKANKQNQQQASKAKPINKRGKK